MTIHKVLDSTDYLFVVLYINVDSQLNLFGENGNLKGVG